MNIVHSYINPGLKGWRKKGARIHYLKKGDVDISIIFIKSKKRTKNLFLISTGFHLEETSGPIFILDSKRIYPSLKKLHERMNIVLIPVINQIGLKFDEKGPDKYLRYNEKGINYNSNWGSNREKCIEVSLLEKYVLSLFAKYNIIFVFSLHEDSTEFGKGYLWMNKIVKDKRLEIQEKLKKRIPENILGMRNRIGLRKGFVENGIAIVNSKDDSFENFTSEILGIPTLLSEAPFGLSLSQRIFFHRASLNSIPL
ncbi:hypothetical protein A3E15_01630 [Candidatus Woesebacteria bacterium RIFCSPHIGHO2_12_FULL_42_9]|uniref:Peptidase M14 carboxypeptidase A domain-containing protein n=2 Tax=Candidatus Woeseibacteriota TaxID=1752722 RepID=A0A1F8AXA8_9BACT|nr:MAG: hypothetical protein A3A51_04710 [Candidatus Levybacteria bacterium RIFCSPLOWO2_01_FULL_39_10]OGM04912.1 MAG: hypothetical protein A2112_01500 [Candidatus Woesebacteria bacterium GWA1_42_12]OGM56367.1 MAG: hypothetical protein A3E15_01630 [Candidatus Woesebacteria bacterium RIFCSPHIGHO2_12_FULL_42_9]